MYAKTLYAPSRPEHINQFLQNYTRRKTPHFFKYAKNKEEFQVEQINNSPVNHLESLIKNKRLNFKRMMDFDYKILMNNSEIVSDKNVVEKFAELKREYRNHLYDRHADKDEDNIPYIGMIVRNEMYKFGYPDAVIVDMLIKNSYGIDRDRYKKLLWITYGDIILHNVEKNTADFDPYCKKCGKRFKRTQSGQKFCPECQEKARKKKDKQTRTVKCIDCGKEFEVPLSVRNKSRCDECQAEHNRTLEREKKRKQRAKMKVG